MKDLKNKYMRLSCLSKESLSESNVIDFLLLTKSDKRVAYVERKSFNCFDATLLLDNSEFKLTNASMQKAAGLLYQSPAESAKNAVDKEKSRIERVKFLLNQEIEKAKKFKNIIKGIENYSESALIYYINCIHLGRAMNISDNKMQAIDSITAHFTENHCFYYKELRDHVFYYRKHKEVIEREKNHEN